MSFSLLKALVSRSLALVLTKCSRRLQRQLGGAGQLQGTVHSRDVALNSGLGSAAAQ